MNLFKTLAFSALLLTAAPAIAQQGAVVSDTPQIIAHSQSGASAKLSNPITDAQRKQLSALKDKFELDTAEKQAQLHVTERQLRDALTADTVDKSAAAALQGKINSLRAELSNARLNFMLAAGDVFTPEQRAEFKQMHQRWGHGHHGFRGGHECGPGGCGPMGKEGCPKGGKPPVG